MYTDIAALRCASRMAIRTGRVGRVVGILGREAGGSGCRCARGLDGGTTAARSVRMLGLGLAMTVSPSVWVLGGTGLSLGRGPLGAVGGFQVSTIVIFPRPRPPVCLSPARDAFGLSRRDPMSRRHTKLGNPRPRGAPRHPPRPRPLPAPTLGGHVSTGLGRQLVFAFIRGTTNAHSLSVRQLTYHVNSSQSSSVTSWTEMSA